MILIGSFLCLIPFDWVKQKSAQAIAQVYNIYVAHHRYFKKYMQNQNIPTQYILNFYISNNNNKFHNNLKYTTLGWELTKLGLDPV